MDTVTYPDPKVSAHLAAKAACYKPNIGEQTDLARRLGVRWTPGLLWTDAGGRVHHANTGYFEPSEFLPEFEFGCAQVLAGQEAWEAAQKRFDDVVERWPESGAAPAALYWAGVAAKRASGDVEPLLERWRRLRERYSDSSWAMKVSFID